MTSYKNIPLFDDCDSEDFLVWRELLLSYMDAHHPETAQLLRVDEMEEINESQDVDNANEDDEGEDDAEAGNIVNRAVNRFAEVVEKDPQAKARNRRAKGHILFFGSDTAAATAASVRWDGGVVGSSHPIRAMARRSRSCIAATIRLVQTDRHRKGRGHVQSL
jgi:hypothetical protein